MRRDQEFFREKITKIFKDKNQIIDIGGGLKIDESRNNRGVMHHWAIDLAKGKDYKIMDKVPDYNPDIVGDIHSMPFKDNSLESVLCLDVLEHVEEPQKAAKEMHRVLKKGGYCYVKTPFIFYYHPEKGYYKDFYRFTRDGLEYMLRDFSHVEIVNERGALSTVMNLLPIFTRKTGFFEYIDRLTGKDRSEQTSAYHCFCIK